MATTPLNTDGLPTGYPFKPDWETTPRAVHQQLARSPSDLLLVDCRRPDEHQLARIPGAVLVPLAELESRVDDIQAAAGPRAKAQPIVIHCHHGMRSLKAAAALRALGFTDVRSMAGGIDLWSIDIDPSVPRY